MTEDCIEPVKIGPHYYSVRFLNHDDYLESLTDKDDDLKGSAAYVWHSVGEITVRLNYIDGERGEFDTTESERRDGLLHEILHCCLRNTGLHYILKEDEEPVVHGLATQLLGVLRDNPELVRYLTA